MMLFCDDKSTISIKHNSIQYYGITYIEIYRHFINENLDSVLITISYISYGRQLEYLLTNGLPTEQISQLTCKLGMLEVHSPTSGSVENINIL